MNEIFKTIAKSFALNLLNLGFDVRKLPSYKNLPKYLYDRRKWLRQNGKISKYHMILTNFDEDAGSVKGHYFHQDLLVSSFIHQHSPIRHVDVGSRIDGFVAHVASFRKIEIIDIRALDQSVHQNIKFIQADLMNPISIGQTDSISCLHAIEHFGLGRYNDPIDVDGHSKGITNLIKMVSVGGTMYISFPIGEKEEVHFNAHRVFKPHSILAHQMIKECMSLIRFDYVDDAGNLHTDTNVEHILPGLKFGCGIYTFKKIKDA